MELLQFVKSRRGGELVGVVVLALGVTLAAALFSYHPNDSSAFFTSTNSVISNWIGYYGATIAWVFVGFFGLASLLFPSALLVVGWNRFWAKELEYAHTKLLGVFILAISLPPMCDLTLGKIWLRGALVPSGGYLGSEIDAAITRNLNASGAAIVFVTALLVGLLLATRISLAAIFLAAQAALVSVGRSSMLQWARLTERRRKEKMKETILRKHLENTEERSLRLVGPEEGVARAGTANIGPVVREVKGAGRFQIRKVTKADLRKAAEELSKQETQDPFALYAAKEPVAEVRVAPPTSAAKRRESAAGVGGATPPRVLDIDPDFEDPLFLEPRPPRTRPQVPRPAT
ncbi:MAG: DNA translocase FtsK 4TM domain-containing protein, partial [Thermoanaerobaculia bacterium]